MTKIVENEIMIKMFNDGCSDADIGEALGVSKQTIRKRRQRKGLKRTDGGAPLTAERIKLDVSKIKDDITREELEYQIDKLERNIAWNKQQKIDDKWGATPEYYKQYDIYIEADELSLWNLLNPKKAKHELLMTGYKKTGRKESTKMTPEARYKFQLDNYLSNVLCWSDAKYKKFKKGYLGFPGATLRIFYDYMINQYLPEMEIKNTFNYKAELLGDTDVR